MMDEKHLFEQARKEGIDPFVLSDGLDEETSVSTFNGTVENQTIGKSQSVCAVGIREGRHGVFETDAIDEKTPQILLSGVKESSLFGREDDPRNYFDGKASYREPQTWMDDFQEAGLEEIRKTALLLEDEARRKDGRIEKVSVSVSKIVSRSGMRNSLGLNVTSGSRFYVGYVDVVARDKDDVRSGGCSFTSFHSLEDLVHNARKEIPNAVAQAVDFFHSGPVETGAYPVILSPDAVVPLLSNYLDTLNAKRVEKHLSLFEGKVGEKIASGCFSLRHTPFACSTSAMKYDSEGVPAQEFDVIKDGRLETYFYALETARHAGKKSNGCAAGNGNGMPAHLDVLPGKKTVEALREEVQDGLEIIEFHGTNAGIDSTTLDFQLPCSGYLLHGGKRVKAVSMILASGNLRKVFEDLSEAGTDLKETGGILTPSLLVPHALFIAGK